MSDPLAQLILGAFAVGALIAINVLSCAYALGRFHAWKRDNDEE